MPDLFCGREERWYLELLNWLLLNLDLALYEIDKTKEIIDGSKGEIADKIKIIF